MRFLSDPRSLERRDHRLLAGRQRASARIIAALAAPVRAMEAAGLERMLEWLADQPASNPRDVAQLIAAAALRRHESRGAHVRLDFPAEDPALAHRMPCPAQPQTV